MLFIAIAMLQWCQGQIIQIKTSILRKAIKHLVSEQESYKHSSLLPPVRPSLILLFIFFLFFALIYLRLFGNLFRGAGDLIQGFVYSVTEQYPRP